MRLTSFGIVLVLMTSFLAGRTNAQIPEQTLFQPGSYAYGAYHGAPTPGGAMEKVLIEVPTGVFEEDEAGVEDEEGEDPTKTIWENKFGTKEKVEKTELVEMYLPVEAAPSAAGPYLAWHRCPTTGRIHLVPYQPGYAENPDAFPKNQSRVKKILSSLPSQVQDRPQVKYLGYYDPMPEVIEDKPSRVQLILGYPNSTWSTCCNNRWGFRMAQCPGVVPPACGPFAEPGIRDQESGHMPQTGPMGGVFAGPRPIDYGPMGPPPRQRVFGMRGNPMALQAYGTVPCFDCPPQVAPQRPAPRILPAPAPCIEQPCEKKASCRCKSCLGKGPRRAVCPPAKKTRPTCDIEPEAEVE